MHFDSWREARKLISDGMKDVTSAKIIVTGAQNSFKSTFLAYLVNHLLSCKAANEVYLLDVDLGQPIFGMPGSMSLVRVTEPILCNSFAEVNYEMIAQSWLDRASPIGDIEGFLASAKRLMSSLPAECLTLVNTGGWIDGLGAEILHNLARNIVVATKVINMTTGAKSSQQNEFVDLARAAGVDCIEVVSDKQALETTQVKGSVARNRRILNALLGRDLAFGEQTKSAAFLLGCQPAYFIDFSRVTFCAQDAVLAGDSVEALFSNLLPFNRQIVALISDERPED